ncbi:MAG: GIY-YIG nuclease family protein, partial [Spirochaetales bacterium]|nr:GIY-YIG nuclease family protein [Spirochaetales bacterium]
MAGKTIKLYISGEDCKNLKTAELSQWTGTAYIGERKHTKLIQKIDELTLPGIYFLLSNEETSSSLKKIYIGEAHEVNKRINNHYRQKEWWDSFVIFVSKDTNLTKAHVRYLEKELYSIAKDKITSFQLMNSSEPTGSKLPQSDRDDMIIFKENMIFILNHLGIINFSIKDDSEMVTNQDELFLLNLT